MLSPDAVRQGQHVMAVCNACRYCEGYCPVFPAMENRLVFAKHDLAYLANLCHNCGECLYACQFAPPHEFGINVPRTLAEVRLGSYEEYCWPAALSGAFRHHSVAKSWALAAGSSAVLIALALMSGAAMWPAQPAGDFYAVVPHGVMVALFGLAGGVCPARAFDRLRQGAARVPSARSVRLSGPAAERPAEAGRYCGGSRDALTLRHLHASRRGLHRRRGTAVALAPALSPSDPVRLRPVLCLDERGGTLPRRFRLARALRLR